MVFVCNLQKNEMYNLWSFKGNPSSIKNGLEIGQALIKQDGLDRELNAVPSELSHFPRLLSNLL